MEITHSSALTHWIEAVFHVHPPDHIVMAVFAAVFLTGFAFFFRRRISLDNPGKLQLVLEGLIGGLLSLLRDNVGAKGRPFLGMVGTIGLFILVGNLLGLIPFFSSPTVNVNMPVGCALVAFAYYNYQGIREHGAKKYFAHFLGPSPYLAIVMLPIEIISHLSRILSLSMRLFGNIFGEELVVVVLAFLVPLVIPVPMMAFGVFGSFLQAFVFTMLTVIYLGGAVTADEH